MPVRNKLSCEKAVQKFRHKNFFTAALVIVLETDAKFLNLCVIGFYLIKDIQVIQLF